MPLRNGVRFVTVRETMSRRIVVTVRRSFASVLALAVLFAPSALAGGSWKSGETLTSASFVVVGSSGKVVADREDMNAENVGDLYLLSRSGKVLRRLTHTKWEEREPAWSPDGRRIAFVRGSRDCGPGEDCTIEADGPIWVMGASGGGARQLTRPDVSPFGDSSPSWSPDGKQVLFNREGVGVFVIGADGSGEHRLVLVQDVDWAGWSPDGTQIAYASKGRLHYLDLASGKRGTDARLAGVYNNVAWSPDGLHLAVDDCPRQLGRGVCVLPRGPGRARLIAKGDFYDPTWSPDGSHVALVGAGIWVVRSSGQGLRRITKGSLFFEDPHWRPAR